MNKVNAEACELFRDGVLKEESPKIVSLQEIQSCISEDERRFIPYESTSLFVNGVLKEFISMLDDGAMSRPYKYRCGMKLPRHFDDRSRFIHFEAKTVGNSDNIVRIPLPMAYKKDYGEGFIIRVPPLHRSIDVRSRELCRVIFEVTPDERVLLSGVYKVPDDVHVGELAMKSIPKQLNAEVLVQCSKLNIQRLYESQAEWIEEIIPIPRLNKSQRLYLWDLGTKAGELRNALIRKVGEHYVKDRCFWHPNKHYKEVKQMDECHGLPTVVVTGTIADLLNDYKNRFATYRIEGTTFKPPEMVPNGAVSRITFYPTSEKRNQNRKRPTKRTKIKVPVARGYASITGVPAPEIWIPLKKAHNRRGQTEYRLLKTMIEWDKDTQQFLATNVYCPVEYSGQKREELKEFEY